MLDLGSTGFLLGFLLLLAVELLVALGFFRHGFLGQPLLGVVDFDLAFMLQALLFLLFFTDLLDLLLVDQTGFEQLVAKGKAHRSLTYVRLLSRSWAGSFPDVWLRPTAHPCLLGCNLQSDDRSRAMPAR
ncbi:hypothetical protein D3C72_1654990 [compost metagenome]